MRRSGMMKMVNVISRAAVVPAILALVLVACGRSDEAGNSSGTPAPSTPAVSGSGSASANPFDGDWDTGPYPVGQIRAAIIAAGVTDEDLNGFMRAVGMTDAARWEFRLSFYQEGGVPYVEATGWNPDEGEPFGGSGDHGPYKLLPNHRIQFLFDYSLMSYRLSGDRLTLRFIRSNDPSFTPAQRRHDAPFVISWTAAPLIRVT
jgi:hypothetical protein